MKMMGHSKDSFLQALKSVYGRKESPGYWKQMYKQYHTMDLEMKQAAQDPAYFLSQTTEFLLD